MMTGAVVVALAVAFATLRARPAPSLDVAGAPAPAGAAVYERLGCAACHALRGAGNPRRPLDGVGTRLSRDQLRGWVVEPQRMKPGVQKPAYDREPGTDIDALLDYLQRS